MPCVLIAVGVSGLGINANQVLCAPVSGLPARPPLGAGCADAPQGWVSSKKSRCYSS